MSTKLTMALAFIFVASSFTGCANENKPYFTKPIIQLKGGNCLKGASGTVDRFMKGEAQTTEVDVFWDCASYAVRTFQEKVEGSDQLGYSSMELRDFLERYFLGGEEKDAVKVDDSLLREMMGLKRLFVGGSDTFITRQELDRALELFNELRVVTVGLVPHVQLAFHRNDGVMPTNEAVDAAVDQIIESFGRVGAVIESNNVEYSIQQLERLLLRLNEFFQKQEKSDTFDKVQKMIPLFAKAKAILLNSSEDKIGGKEWRSTLDITARGFALYLRGYFFMNEKSLFDASRLFQFEKMAAMAVELFTDAFARRNDEPIRLEETDSLIDALSNVVTSLPFGLTVEQFKSMWRTVVDKILVGDQSKNVPGLAVGEIKRLDIEFADWLTIQHWLLGQESQPKTESIDEMIMVLNSPWPLNMDVEGRLVFAPDTTAPWNVESMSRMNWLRAVFRLVLTAYIKDESRRKNLVGLSKDEFFTAYTDLKPFLVALDLVEEDNTTFGSRVLREANLFTSRANGDKYLNFVELIEYVHYILSGIDAGKMFVEVVKADCPVVNDSIDAPCFRFGLQKYFADRYAHLPLMVSYATVLTSKGWAKVISSLESATRDEGVSNIPVKTSDIYEMGILLQYIETVMLRFDLDLNAHINLKEGLQALPLFENVLAEFADMDPRKDAKDIRAIYTYMLKNGEPPDRKNPIDIVKFLFWKWTENSWKVNADRGVLLQILSSLSSL